MHIRSIACIGLCVAIAFALPLAAAASEGRRGVLFQLGAGLSAPSYPSEVEALMSYMEALDGVYRVKLSLDLGLGIALSEKAFLMGRIDGMGDRLYDSSDYLQLNLYLYSLGLRYYPSVTGLYLEGNVGASDAVLQSSSEGSSSSGAEPGFGVALGYDFCRESRGFGLAIEARYDYLDIEGDQFGCLMATLNLCWK